MSEGKHAMDRAVKNRYTTDKWQELLSTSLANATFVSLCFCFKKTVNRSTHNNATNISHHQPLTLVISRISIYL
jgi:hypothetical protein